MDLASRSGNARPGASTLSIVHPWDPWAQGIGGFDTALDGFLRTAPAEWGVELIGITTDSKARPVGRWRTEDFWGRRVAALAVLRDPEPDRVRPIPLALRFVLECRRRRVWASGKIVQFHRFESDFAVPRLAGQRRVYFLHNHPPEVRLAKSGVRWRRLGSIHERLLLDRLRTADAVMSVDPRTAAWVRARIPSLAAKVHGLRQWADPNVFRVGLPEQRKAEELALREQMGVPASARIVMFAGRLELQKDPLVLLDVFERVAKQRADVWLMIVGKGRLRQPVHERARVLHLEARVVMMDPVPRGELPPLYRAADVVVCTSAFEGGPRYVFEALACGTPVVSFDVGQVRSTMDGIPSAGRVLASRDPDAFAEAVLDVLVQARSWEDIRRCADTMRALGPANSLAPVFEMYRSWVEADAVRGGLGA